jgi:hypothetical protein
MVTQGYTATLVAATLAISRSSLYFQKRPRGSRADRTCDEQIVIACGEKPDGWPTLSHFSIDESKLVDNTTPIRQR